MDNRPIIQECLDFIDAHIKEPMNLTHLAARSGFSYYHFQRIFQSLVGCPLGEYLRRRRLAFAAAELQSGRRIVDIAQDFGFETHAGFTRAFQKVYGSPPERYRQHAVHPQPCRVCLSEQNFNVGGMIMEPKFIDVQAFDVVGYALETTNAEGENNVAIPQFWQEYMQAKLYETLEKQPGADGSIEYGICFPSDPNTGRFRYCIGLKTSAITEADPNLFTGSVPAGHYAVFTTPPAERSQFSATIQQTWQHIFQTWLPQSGYQMAEGHPDFELYDERCHTDNGAVMDIYIPIVKK